MLVSRCSLPVDLRVTPVSLGRREVRQDSAGTWWQKHRKGENSLERHSSNSCSDSGRKESYFLGFCQWQGKSSCCVGAVKDN